MKPHSYDTTFTWHDTSVRCTAISLAAPRCRLCEHTRGRASTSVVGWCVLHDADSAIEVGKGVPLDGHGGGLALPLALPSARLAAPAFLVDRCQLPVWSWFLRADLRTQNCRESTCCRLILFGSDFKTMWAGQLKITGRQPLGSGAWLLQLRHVSILHAVCSRTRGAR